MASLFFYSIIDMNRCLFITILLLHTITLAFHNEFQKQHATIEHSQKIPLFAFSLFVYNPNQVYGGTMLLIEGVKDFFPTHLVNKSNKARKKSEIAFWLNTYYNEQVTQLYRAPAPDNDTTFYARFLMTHDIASKICYVRKMAFWAYCFKRTCAASCNIQHDARFCLQHMTDLVCQEFKKNPAAHWQAFKQNTKNDLYSNATQQQAVLDPLDDWEFPHSYSMYHPTCLPLRAIVGYDGNHFQLLTKSAEKWAGIKQNINDLQIGDIETAPVNNTTILDIRQFESCVMNALKASYPIFTDNVEYCVHAGNKRLCKAHLPLLQTILGKKFRR